MTLHAAIEKLLLETGRPMTTYEIADAINQNKSYQKKDGTPLTDFQIHGRTKNYTKHFVRNGTIVSLKTQVGVCAYIDILGFKTFVNESPQDALKVLQNYQVNFLNAIPKKDAYTTPYGTDSFKYLIPFSDSVFFYSESPSDFVMQLANFVNSSFRLTSHVYSDPEDPAFPERVMEKGVVLEGGKMVMKSFRANWYPVLFRGGIGFGDARIGELNCIHNNAPAKTPFVFGNSVIEAVKLESLIVGEKAWKIKGPRILCTFEFYKLLSKRAKKIVHPAFDIPDYYELNWTAVNYLMTDNPNKYFVKQLLLNDFYINLMVPAANLWKAYRKKGSEIESQYKNLIKLIIRGVQHYFSKSKFEKQVRTFLDETFLKLELKEIEDFLLS